MLFSITNLTLNKEKYLRNNRFIVQRVLIFTIFTFNTKRLKNEMSSSS